MTVICQIARIMGPTWGPTCVLSVPGGPHVGPMNLAIRDYNDWFCFTVPMLMLVFRRRGISWFDYAIFMHSVCETRYSLKCRMQCLLLLDIPRYQHTFGINTLKPRQKFPHVPDDILKCILLNINVWIRLRFYWRLFVRAQLTIFQHRFR